MLQVFVFITLAYWEFIIRAWSGEVLIYSRTLTHACNLLNHKLKEYPSKGEGHLAVPVASLLTWWSCLSTGFGSAISRAHHRAVRSLLVEAARSFSAMTNRVSMKQTQVRTGSNWEKGAYAYGCNMSYLCTLWNQLSASGVLTCWQSPCVSPGWCKWPCDAFSVLCGCWCGRKHWDTPFYPEGLPPATQQQNQLLYPPFSLRNRFLHVILFTLLQQNSGKIYFVEYLCFTCVLFFFLNSLNIPWKLTKYSKQELYTIKHDEIVKG